MISLFGKAYRVSPRFIQTKIEVHYNPEHLELVEIWNEGKFFERVSPYIIHFYRPEKVALPENPVKPPDQPTDFLGFLLNTYGKTTESDGVPGPALCAEQITCAAFLALFKKHLPWSLYDEEELKRFWIRYGPINLEEVQALMNDPALLENPYHHISSYLNALKGARP